MPWIPDPRPPFKIWVKPEQIAPFFLIPHHPYAISLLLKISDEFRTEEFRRLGLIGSSEDWERLVRGVIQEFEENNSGVDLFHFDSEMCIRDRKTMKQDFTIWRNQILKNPWDISPLKFEMTQDEVIEIFGNPDAVSTMRSDGKPLILKYHDIELHFDGKAHRGLHLIYSDDEIELSITAEHEEMLQPITNTEPVDNEFFLRDGAVYFSGLYENGLLKGAAPKDFCCWCYWGKSSTACFLGGIRLRGADPASFRVLNYAYAMDKTAVYTTSGRIPDVELAAFQVLDNGQNDSGAPQGYAKDSRQVYFHNGDGKVKIIKGAEVSSFRSLGDTYFARDEKRIYAYGKQLSKAELTSWELLGHWYSRDAKRVYYLCLLYTSRCV